MSNNLKEVIAHMPKQTTSINTSNENEIRFNTIQDLIQFIDSNEHVSQNLNVLRLNGNEIDVLKLVIRYKLKFSDESYNHVSYSTFKLNAKPEENSFLISPSSMYGNIITRCIVRGHLVEILFNLKSSYEHNFVSKIANKFTRNTDYVVLDIETTGLNPLLDDIIEICIFKSEGEYFNKYLPLEKKTTNSAFNINGISDDVLKIATPLSQKLVNDIIEKFDLKNKVVAIWTGKNLFDRLFLESYFLEHNLTGLENITFFNARNLIKDYEELNMQYCPKDYIASLYNINIKNAHNALEDCIIEHSIIENLLNGDISPLLETNYKKCVSKIKKYFGSKCKPKFYAEVLYNEFCDALVLKNGPVLNDYDSEHSTRGSEWIDIHHIDEKTIDDISTRTFYAKLFNDITELERLKPHNKKERLVYATKIEHFILHCLIDVFRKGFSGGPHWIFGDILRMQIGHFPKGTKEQKIQQNQENFYKSFSLDEIIDIYRLNLKLSKSDLDYCVDNFYKLNQYEYDEELLLSFKKQINRASRKKQ